MYGPPSHSACSSGGTPRAGSDVLVHAVLLSQTTSKDCVGVVVPSSWLRTAWLMVVPRVSAVGVVQAGVQ
jgi:hypothetical protein